MTNWRLVGDILAIIIVDRKEVYFSGVEKPGYLRKVKSQINSSSNLLEIRLVPEDYNVNFNNGRVFINSPFLPTKDDYEIKNFDYSTESLLDLLSNLTISKGKLSETAELVLNSSLGLVRLVTRSMPSYGTYKDELIRRVNCDIRKKTVKWVPGNRYDSPDQSLYYLGEIRSHKKLCETDSAFLTELGMEKGHLAIVYDHSLGEFSTLQDLIKEARKTDKLLCLPKTKAMVDCGKVLEIDVSYNESIKNQVLAVSSSEIPMEIKFRNIVDILNYESLDEDFEMDEVTKQLITNVIKNCVKDILPNYWNRPSQKEFCISKDNTIKENSENFFNLLIAKSGINNRKRFSYVNDLFNHYKIGIKEIIQEEFLVWSPISIFEDFDKYAKYCNKLYELDKTLIVKLRTTLSSRIPLEKSTLESSITSVDNTNVLLNTIKGLVKYARNHGGVGTSMYNVVNAGTKKVPLLFEEIVISVDSIVSYYKELGLEIPENLKSDIIFNKFCRVKIYVDEGSEIV